jgi:hypothetical protein
VRGVLGLGDALVCERLLACGERAAEEEGGRAEAADGRVLAYDPGPARASASSFKREIAWGSGAGRAGDAPVVRADAEVADGGAEEGVAGEELDGDHDPAARVRAGEEGGAHGGAELPGGGGVEDGEDERGLVRFEDRDERRGGEHRGRGGGNAVWGRGWVVCRRGSRWGQDKAGGDRWRREERAPGDVTDADGVLLSNDHS